MLVGSLYIIEDEREVLLSNTGIGSFYNDTLNLSFLIISETDDSTNYDLTGEVSTDGKQLYTTLSNKGDSSFTKNANLERAVYEQ